MSKVTLLRLSYCSSESYELVKQVNFTKDLSSKMKLGCSWMQIHMLYSDHQCLVHEYIVILSLT